MQRGEGRAILHVARDRADEHLRAAVLSDADDVAQIRREVFIHPLHARVVQPHLLLKKHLHAVPLGRHGGFARELPLERIQQLTEPRGLEPEAGANDGQRRRLLTEDRARAERPHHLVVAHVHEPVIALLVRAILRNLADDVGIDRSDGDIDDFDLLPHHRAVQQHIKDARKTKRRLRVAHRRRLAEDEDAEGVRRLRCGETHRLRRALKPRRKIAPGEFRVLDEHLTPAGFRFKEEAWRVTVAAHPEDQFEQEEIQQQRRDGDDAKPELTPWSKAARPGSRARSHGPDTARAGFWLLCFQWGKT